MVHAGKGGGRMFVNAARINGRKSNFSLLEYIQSEVRAGESPVPPWMPTCLINPPITIPNVPHPGPLRYPEDRLRKIWFNRHPEAKNIKLKTVYVGEHRYWQHPATSFVHRQSKLINKGYSEQEAYNIVEEEDKRDARHRELERIVAIEQAKELGFEDLETARDLLAPRDLSQARERMLEELVEVLKLKGIPNVVPELLPKGMKWRDVLAFTQKYPQHAHYFNLSFVAAHAITTGNPEIADAFMWIYGGEVITDEPTAEELAEVRQYFDDGDDYEGQDVAAGADDTDDLLDEGLEELADDIADDIADGALNTVDDFFGVEPSSGGDDEVETSGAGPAEEEETPEEMAARLATIQAEAEKFKKILNRIEKVYRPEQFPVTEEAVWSNLVDLLALRPKAPDVKLARKAEELLKAQQAQQAQKGRAKTPAKKGRSTGPAAPKAKGKEVELQ